MKRAEAQAILGGLAADQHGLITSAQAMAHGVDGVTLLRLREAGLVDGVGRGVYQVAGATTPSHLEIRVAWLRLDPARPAWERDGRGRKDAVVSHRSACLVHELGDIPAPKVELTVPGRLTTRERWVTLHQHPGPLEPREITVVEGLPVTSVERTILDLLRDGADAGHVGGVIADADHRGLLDISALAERVEQFADHYAMPQASGTELLSALTAEAGQRLNQEAALELLKEVATAGALAGYEDAVRQFLHVQVPTQDWLANMDLARTLEPIQDAARRVAELHSPAISAFKQTTAARVAEQLAPIAGVLHGASVQSALRQELVKAMPSNETILALMRTLAALNDPKVKAAPGAVAPREDDVSKEAP